MPPAMRRCGGGAEPWFSGVFSPGVPCYVGAMTEIMKQAIAAASQLSLERQEELARYLLALSHRIGDVPLGAEEGAARGDRARQSLQTVPSTHNPRRVYFWIKCRKDDGSAWVSAQVLNGIRVSAHGKITRSVA